LRTSAGVVMRVSWLGRSLIYDALQNERTGISENYAISLAA